MEMAIEHKFFQEHKESLGRRSGEYRIEFEPVS